MTDYHSQTSNESLTFSPAGETRREVMLGELTTHMRRQHRRRRVLRLGGAIAGLVVLATGVVALSSLVDSSRGRTEGDRVVSGGGEEGVSSAVSDRGEKRFVGEFGVESRRSETAGSESRGTVDFKVVRTTPGIAERYATDPERVVEIIDDRELLETLAEIGRPAGLIRIGDEVRLTAAVTDAELAEKEDHSPS